MNLQAMKYPDGSAVVRVGCMLSTAETGYKTVQTIVAGVFQEGPEVVLWPVSELEQNATTVEMSEASYVVDSFGGHDALVLAIDSFCHVRLGRKIR